MSNIDTHEAEGHGKVVRCWIDSSGIVTDDSHAGDFIHSHDTPAVAITEEAYRQARSRLLCIADTASTIEYAAACAREALALLPEAPQ